MAQQTFSFIERRAFWEAHNKRCAYCTEPLSFASLEIDHIVPESCKNLSAVDWEKLKRSHGLADDFNLIGYENLMSSCGRCNSRKSGEMFKPGLLAINLAVAHRARPRVEKLVARFTREDEQDKLRFQLASGLESGSITSNDISKALTDARAKSGKFKLNSSFPLFGDASIMEISKEMHEEYLDKGLVLPDWIREGLRLVNEAGEEKFVKTLREYQEATDRSFYALSNAEMKSAYSLFIRPLRVLELLKTSKLAEKSFIDDPRKGLADVDSLPATLLFAFPPDSLDPQKAIFQGLQSKTIGDLNSQGLAKITRVSSDLLSVEFQDCWTLMFELMRVDVNDDGIQELVINWSGGPLQGTLSTGAVMVLSKASEEQSFTVLDL